MAKTMYQHKWIKTGEQKGKEALSKTMGSIDQELRKPNPIRPGARKIILEAYQKNGKNGAMLALVIYNKRQNVKFTWDDVEKWLKEEREKLGEEYGIN